MHTSRFDGKTVHKEGGWGWYAILWDGMGWQGKGRGRGIGEPWNASSKERGGFTASKPMLEEALHIGSVCDFSCCDLNLCWVWL